MAPVTDNDKEYKSYQHDDIFSSSRALPPPTIRQYEDNIDEESNNTNGWARGLWTGNSSLRPNVGLTNFYDTDPCGQALHLTVRQLRYTACLLSATTILLVAWTWWIRFLFLQWTVMVVSLYLAFLALILGISEVAVLIQGGMPWALPAPLMDDNNGGNLPELSASPPDLVARPVLLLHDQFGFLYHPTGKPLMLLLMSTMCFAMDAFWEFFLGAAFFGLTLTVVLLGREAEFRRLYYPPYHPADREEDASRQNVTSTRSWSYYSTSISSLVQEQTAETASLLQSKLRPAVSV